MEKKHKISLLVIFLITALTVLGWGYFVMVTRLGGRAQEVETLAGALVAELEEENDVQDDAGPEVDYKDEMIRRWRMRPEFVEGSFSDTIVD